MEIISKYKNKIVMVISALLVFLFIVFMSIKFTGNSNKEVSFDFSKPYNKIAFNIYF